jgi:uncharacterized repeat protein (TIGR03843 family)
VAAFDVLVGNGDRKAGHCLLAADGRIWVVDHGLCFSADPWLRTVIWDFAGEAVSQAVTGDLGRVAVQLRTGPLRAALSDLLDRMEIDAAAERAEALATGGTLPRPGPGRSLPWPAV